LQKVCLDGEVGELGGLIKSQVTRIASLLDRVQQLTKPLQSELTPTDLVKLVETQLQAFRLAYPGTTWDCDVDCEVSSMLCDPQLIERLVSNAAENAVCAMDGGGEVVVEIGLDVQPDGSWAEIRFRDLGPGFPQSVLEHLFEPFVSTRPDGTGLGLTIMREICLLHGGDLSVRNTDPGALVTARLRTQ
jgi:signal transduction histidine kinase